MYQIFYNELPAVDGDSQAQVVEADDVEAAVTEAVKGWKDDNHFLLIGERRPDGRLAIAAVVYHHAVKDASQKPSYLVASHATGRTRTFRILALKGADEGGNHYVPVSDTQLEYPAPPAQK